MIFISILILIVAIALPSFQQHISSILFTRISSILLLYAGGLSLNALYIQSIGSGIGIYSGLFHVTLISQLLDIFIFTIGALILIAWPLNNVSLSSNSSSSSSLSDYKINNHPCTEYSLLIMFSTLGSSLLVSSADLISMYLSIELQSFGVYILSTLYRHSESATSAGLKYFLLGGLSSCLILLGSALLYSYTGLTHFESIYSLTSISYDNSIIQGISLGFVIIFIGYLFKIAGAPFHNWAPDVYDDSPTIVTIWLTIMPKIAILILLLELKSGLSLSSISYLIESISSLSMLSNNIVSLLTNLLLISSLLSLLIGTVVGLSQTRIKRLLAYSTISHIGFMLLALAINTEQSTESLLFYIIQYSLTNLNVFLIILALGYIIHLHRHNKHTDFYGSNADINYISDLRGQFYSNPILSISLSICLFSMAGVPPLIGFFSKQFVLSSAIQNGYYFMSIIAILVSIISASYYLKIIRVLHTEISTEDKEAMTHDSELPVESVLSNVHSFLISSLTLSILLFILKPSIILNSIHILSLFLFNS